jgi:mannose-1-phosphate guanylyltransferase
MSLHFMALWQRADKDCSENVRQGDVLTENCRSVSVNAQSRLVAAIGLDDVVVGETKDGIWVVHKTHAQDVKKIIFS